MNDVRIQEQVYTTLKMEDKLRFGYDILSLASGTLFVVLIIVFHINHRQRTLRKLDIPPPPQKKKKKTQKNSLLVC